MRPDCDDETHKQPLGDDADDRKENCLCVVSKYISMDSYKYIFLMDGRGNARLHDLVYIRSHKNL